MRIISSIIFFFSLIFFNSTVSNLYADDDSGLPSDIQWMEVPTEDNHILKVAIVRPLGEGPFPSVVIFHGAEGFRPHYLELALKFRDAGFVGIAAAWFSGSHPGGQKPKPDVISCPNCPDFKGSNLSATPYVATVLEAIKKLSYINPAQIGLFGHSAGAKLVVLSASNDIKVQAVVAVSGGYTKSKTGSPAPIAIAPKLSAPLLILNGTADTQCPLNEVQKYEKTLRKLGKSIEAHYYEGATHGLTWSSPTKEDVTLRAIRFFKTHLGNQNA